MSADMHRALELPEIREHILQFCSRRDLLACRLVSRDWRDSSVKAWNSKARINLADWRKTSGFLGFLKSGRAPPKPFVHFCVSFSLKGPKTTTRFWSTCGDNVKILELNRCVFRNADDLRAVLFQLCPNMEKLSVKEISIGRSRRRRTVVEPVAWTEPRFGEHRKLKSLTVDDRASKNTGISWMEYFSHFSSLETLRIHGVHFGDANIFQAVARIRQRDPSKLKLKQLKFYYCSRSFNNAPSPAAALMNVLLDPGLQLESLTICVNRLLAEDIQSSALFRTILNAHRASLRTLELNWHFRDADNYLLSWFCLELNYFPGKFKNLTQVTFMSTCIWSLNFLKYTPNLRKLSVKYKNDILRGFFRIIGNTNFDGMRDLQLTKLKKLELNFKETVSSDVFQRLMDLMPNVRKLKMPLDNILCAVVCQRLEKLEALEIVRGDVDSFGLIGLESCPLFFRQRKNKPCIPFPTSATVPNANITCLKNLRNLSIEGPTVYDQHGQNGRPTSLSHWAAHLGIEQLPHLEHLRLSNYDLETVCGVWKRLLELYPWPRHGTQW